MERKDQRLIRHKRFALPIPEVVIAIVGLIMVFVFPERQYFELNGWAVLALACGVIALPLGVPLLFFKVSFYWGDITYIIVGILLVKFVISLPDGPNIGAGALAFLGVSFVISGCSHVLRRALASSSVKKKVHNE
ncbi:hypothetical protein [Corynebacterium sp. J010B-136]|uniref:hypothetical protein n=1 Tax=Corynebacterium sp. J010B-136 TaxID=2099401 RepID=UPI000CF9EE8C|nr:hypothetical protein [Corynebacterium sp. J010B-136]PQM74059.1 hypothetical protein C5Y44_09465 [Corynebacterium sp. J010B-136]